VRFSLGRLQHQDRCSALIPSSFPFLLSLRSLPVIPVPMYPHAIPLQPPPTGLPVMLSRGFEFRVRSFPRGVRSSCLRHRLHVHQHPDERWSEACMTQRRRKRSSSRSRWSRCKLDSDIVDSIIVLCTSHQCHTVLASSTNGCSMTQSSNLRLPQTFTAHCPQCLDLVPPAPSCLDCLFMLNIASIDQ
jgi:hypothetical protein